MPTYAFKCDNCDTIIDVNMSFKEHDQMKNKMFCIECKSPMYQTVQRLNFRLAGEGWVGRDGGFNAKGVGYEITQNSMDKSKEDVLKMEDYVSIMSARDENIKEI